MTKIEDVIHMKIYRHPPRTRQIKLAENIHSLLINKSRRDNHDFYSPTYVDRQQYEFNEKDGYLKALISEVKANKFGSDLCWKCSNTDLFPCNHNVYKSKFSISLTRNSNHSS